MSLSVSIYKQQKSIKDDKNQEVWITREPQY